MLSNWVYVVLAQLVIGVGRLALYVAVARLLGQELQGIVALAFTVVTQAVVLGGMGLEMANTYIAGSRKSVASSLVGNALVLSVFLGGGVGVVALHIMLLLKNSYFQGFPISLLWLMSLAIPILLLQVQLMGIVAGLKRFRDRLWAALIQNVVFLLVVLQLVRGGERIERVMVFWLIGTLASVIYLIYRVTRESGALPMPNLALLKVQFGFGLKVYPVRAMNMLMLRADMFIVGGFSSTAQLGLYATAKMAAETLHYVERALAPFFLSESASAFSADVHMDSAVRRIARAYRYTNVLTFIGIAAVQCVADVLIVILFSREFIGSILPFRIILVAMGFRVVGGLAAQGIIGRGRALTASSIMVFGGILNVILLVLMIPVLGIVGAAAAMLVSNIALAGLMLRRLVLESGLGYASFLKPTREDVLVAQKIAKSALCKRRGRDTGQQSGGSS